MKKYLFTFFIAFFIVNSILFPTIALDAAKNGITIWFYQILPSLLPFTILSGILLKSKWTQTLPINGSLIPIILIILCGMVFGFPIGAKLSCDFYKQNLISKSHAQVLCVCTNNFSPMYIMGYVIPLIFGENISVTSILLLLYGVPLFIGIVLLLIVEKREKTHKKSASRFQLNMQIIDAGIISGFETLIKICGYIVLFSQLTAFLCLLTKEISIPQLCILGNLEITNGIHMLSEAKISSSIQQILALQLLSFGGISGLAQSASFLAPAQLSVKQYLIGKVLLSCSITLPAVILHITL